MTAIAFATISLTVLVASFISGVFGLAGGMVLLGILLVFFDVATAMVVFSLLQLVGNLWRTVLWRRFILWRIVVFYVLGSLSAFLLLRFIAYVPSKPFVYFVVGFMPFAIELIPAAWRPNIEWRGVPTFSGFVTSLIQFIAGTGGLFLDVFFQKSTLDRKTTIATKAIAQAFTHVLRAFYYGSLGWMSDAMPAWGYATGIALSITLEDLAWWSNILSRARAEGELLPGTFRARAAAAASKAD